MFRFFSLFAMSLVVSCAQPTTASRFIPDDGFAADPLSYTEVSRTLLDDRNYLVSYSQDSGRLGIVDADSFQEIWGAYTEKDARFVFNLPGHEGAGLLSAGNFTVVIKEGSRTFNFPVIADNAWNRATESIALFAYDRAGNKVHAIKYRGESSWEQSTLDAFSDGSAAAAVSVGATGTLALVVAPDSGSYVIVADDGSRYVNRRSCPAGAALAQLPVVSAAVDETSQTAFLAAGSKIFRIDLSADGICTDPAAWTEVYAGEADLKRIGFLARQLFALRENPGAMITFDLVGVGITEKSDIATDCGEPVSLNQFGEFRAIVCANRVSNRSSGEGGIRNVSVKFLGDAGTVELTQKVDFEKKSGIVFNPGKAEFLQVYNSAAGEIDVHAVPSSAVRHIEGIFMEGILNKL